MRKKNGLTVIISIEESVKDIPLVEALYGKNIVETIGFNCCVKKRYYITG